MFCMVAETVQKTEHTHYQDKHTQEHIHQLEDTYIANTENSINT